MNQTEQGLAALAFPIADTPRYGDMSQNFGREQSYFPRAGGIAAVYNPQTGQFVDSGGASKYSYDPRTQTYGMAEGQAEKLIKGQFGPMGGEGSGGSEPVAGPAPGANPLSGLHTDWTGFNMGAARTGLMVGGIPGALLGGIMGGLNVATTTPATGPGTIGVRDNRGSNEAAYEAVAQEAARQAAQESFRGSEITAQNQAEGFGGYANTPQESFRGSEITAQNQAEGVSPASDNTPSGGFSDVGGLGAAAAADAAEGGYLASGGLASLDGARYGAAGGPVEAMSNANAIGANTGYPQSAITTRAYATPYQQPIGQNVVGAQDAGVDPYTGQAQFAVGGITALAQGGAAQYNLGGYSDGGRLLRGPGDGVSDDIPAVIGDKQPARLADGEFVVPARIVSELGNGSTEAGARKLYAMMDRVQKARKKSIGKDQVAADSKAHRLLPA